MGIRGHRAVDGVIIFRKFEIVCAVQCAQDYQMAVVELYDRCPGFTMLYFGDGRSPADAILFCARCDADGDQP